MAKRNTTDAHCWYADVPRQCRGAIIAGSTISAVFFGGFGVWAFTAPIAGAIVSTGSFVAQGQNKIIQSFEGGVISQIFVREGDLVEAGETLVRFDETAAKVDLRRLLLKRARLEATEVRLLKEAGDNHDQPIPVSYTPGSSGAPGLPGFTRADISDPDIRSVLTTQSMAYDAHVTSARNEVANLEQSIQSLKDHLTGDAAQRDAVDQERILYQQEIESKKGLLDKGLIKRSEMLALLRAKAAVQGEIGRLDGDIGDTQAKIARAEEQIRGVRVQTVKTAMDQLVDVRGDLIDTRERIRSAEKIADRIRVNAPVRGIVVKLGYHTMNGVVEPGKPIMEILPLNEELVIETRVRAQDIDSVKKDADAVVRLTALNARITPMLKGKVIYVSADSIQDDPRVDRSAGIYVARIRINKDQMHLVNNFAPTPGMPAEVFIKTKERTFFEYLVRPVRDSMTRAFRES